MIYPVHQRPDAAAHADAIAAEHGGAAVSGASRTLWGDAVNRLKKNKLAIIAVVWIAFIVLVALTAVLRVPQVLGAPNATAAHKAAGAEYIVVPSMRKISTLKDLQTYCRYFNEVGARCAAAGMKFGYHNHSREFEKIEDKVMLDYMLENTDPDKVLFEMDVYWAVMGKASPVDYFKKYPGRIKLLHIKDRREIGQSGMVGFDAIFANAREAGVENIIVEIEGSSYNDIVRSVRECADYLLEAPFVTAFFRNE